MWILPKTFIFPFFPPFPLRHCGLSADTYIYIMFLKTHILTYIHTLAIEVCVGFFMEEPSKFGLLNGCHCEDASNALLLDRSFDFATSEEIAPIPVHEVELLQASYRRHGNAPHDVSLHEFVAMLGITWEDTLHPNTKSSCLEYDASIREYYGDSDDEAYRTFREKMVKFTKWDAWLKGNHFIEKNIMEEYLRLNQFENNAVELLDSNDEASIKALEARMYSEVQSKAHMESLRKYRDDHFPRRLTRRLTLELSRRTYDESWPVSADCDRERLLADSPPQRQWRGKSYKERYMKMYKKVAPLQEPQ
ncbi:hypothetical protein MOQ_002869 [Trypanosoma cruzi marinkellei]|uniref:Uncharacterized protein n=1 Tax=Trypanosoma cruzi marinkellei TaxID=85056 RepID=K2N1E1_TRYCR|nr:hypothetical protein MOQ_002869 [Trypanosoma cruzi marinkellei]